MDAQTEQVVETAVTSTLTKLGFDLSDPIKVQEDMHFLRALRNLAQSAGTKAVMIIVGILVVAIAGGTFLAIGQALAQ